METWREIRVEFAPIGGDRVVLSLTIGFPCNAISAHKTAATIPHLNTKSGASLASKAAKLQSTLSRTARDSNNFTGDLLS